PDLLLRRRVPGRVHLDRLLAVRQAGQQPALPPPGARDAPPGETGAARGGRARPRRPPPSPPIRDHRPGDQPKRHPPPRAASPPRPVRPARAPGPSAATPRPAGPRAPPPPPPLRARLGRAALLTAGATLLGAAACSDSKGSKDAATDRPTVSEAGAE